MYAYCYEIVFPAEEQTIEEWKLLGEETLLLFRFVRN